MAGCLGRKSYLHRRIRNPAAGEIAAIPSFPVYFRTFAAGSRLAAACGMKRILGMAAAAVLVLLQLAGLAALTAEPPMYLAPIDGSQTADERPA